jgi:carbonic anhydrase/acetyltransferase-like protein (isoleucine patch superfamily)
MNQSSRERRRTARFPLGGEALESRHLLSASNKASALLVHPVAYPTIHPNTPIVAFATPSKKAGFIDSSVQIEGGQTVIVGFRSYIAPFASLNGSGGAIKIGDLSDILDSAILVANPHHRFHLPQLLIGDDVSIGYGAKILGPSTIGGYASAAQPTAIGANAVIDSATIQPGAIVSPLAHVGPGVTVPSGYRVLPGVDVTTEAQASNPKLGMVVPVTSSDTSAVKQQLSQSTSLAAGYAQLYQGNSATGANPGANPTISGINNGYLPNIEGASLEPGPSSASFEPSKIGPAFVSPNQGPVRALLSNFPGRIIGQAIFDMKAGNLVMHLGRANSIRADEGQPITIASIMRTGPHVTINSPLGGTLTIGRDFRAGHRAVILGGPSVNTRIGDDVNVGAGAVLDRTSLGSGSTVGPDAYLLTSTFPANTVIPAKAIYISNKFQGYVQS